MDAGELKILETELDAQIREVEAVYGRIEEGVGIENVFGAESGYHAELA